MPVVDADDGRGRVREIRLEGGTLWLALALLLGLVAGAFQLGRWIERDAAVSGGGSVAGPAVTPERPPPVDVDEGAGAFDVGGVAEPQRQAGGSAPASPDAAPASTTPAPRPAAGPWNVQVFAGRDRRAAEQLVQTLTGSGWPVRLVSVEEGARRLVKVRVGGYATRAEAESAATRLRAQGQAGAWVTDRP